MYCKALSTEKYKRYINIFIYFIYLFIYLTQDVVIVLNVQDYSSLLDKTQVNALIALLKDDMKSQSSTTKQVILFKANERG